MTDGRNMNCLIIKEPLFQGRLGGTFDPVCEIEAKRSGDDEKA